MGLRHPVPWAGEGGKGNLYVIRVCLDERGQRKCVRIKTYARCVYACVCVQASAGACTCVRVCLRCSCPLRKEETAEESEEEDEGEDGEAVGGDKVAGLADRMCVVVCV